MRGIMRQMREVQKEAVQQSELRKTGIVAISARRADDEFHRGCGREELVNEVMPEVR
jgi:hypothetical protein